MSLAGGVDEQQAFTLLDHLLAQGFDTVDTADIYSYWAGGLGGESERMIGRWMRTRGNRDRVMVHTKGGAPGAPGGVANADLKCRLLD